MRKPSKKTRLAAVLAVMLAAQPLILSAPVKAETFEQGLDAMRAGDEQRAREIWLPLAEAGDLAAQYSLAKLHEKGGGEIEQDLDQAVKWYQEAADQGMPAAQNNLALMYAQGRGVPTDQRRAVELWRASALQEYPWGQYNLGLAFFRGQGVAADRTEAVAWFRRAADGALAEAQFIMGQLRREGLVVEQDRGQALTWYRMAAQQGHASAVAQFDALVTAGIKPKPVVAAEFVPLGVASGKTPGPRAGASAPDDKPAAGEAPVEEPAAGGAEPPTAAETAAEVATALPRPARKPAAVARQQLAVTTATAAQAPERKAPESKPSADAGDEQLAAATDATSDVQGDPVDKSPRVWLASADSRDEALSLWLQMQARHGEDLANLDAVFAPVVIGDQTLYRILAGPLAGTELAAQLCQRLRGTDANAFCQVRPD